MYGLDEPPAAHSVVSANSVLSSTAPGAAASLLPFLVQEERSQGTGQPECVCTHVLRLLGSLAMRAWNK